MDYSRYFNSALRFLEKEAKRYDTLTIDDLKDGEHKLNNLGFVLVMEPLKISIKQGNNLFTQVSIARDKKEALVALFGKFHESRNSI